jgi:hypothetical protein
MFYALSGHCGIDVANSAMKRAEMTMHLQSTFVGGGQSLIKSKESGLNS